jgi:hypothetical protein
MDSINSKLAGQSLKMIVRHIMNQRKAIFRGEYDAEYPHLVEAFNRLRSDAGDLNDDLTEDLADIINDGICELARRFGDGFPIQPASMNLIILAIRAYNATPNAPFKINDEMVCQNVTTDGLLFLSNVILKRIEEQELFSLQQPPWQLVARHVPSSPRPSSPDMKRAPRIFIIHAHGMVPVVQGEGDDPALPVFEHQVMGYPLGPSGEAVSSRSYRRNRVITKTSKVDTFTSAKFGKPMWLTVTDDPPQVMLVSALTTLLKDAPQPPTTKDAFRQIIKRALCETRSAVVPASEQHDCRFRCHRVGKKIADVTLFCEGAAFVEGIARFDAQTGEVDYITEEFGLVDKRSLGKPVEEYEKFKKWNHAQIDAIVKAKTKAEQELAELRANPVNFKRKEFIMHSIMETIENYETTLRGMDRYSHFEFSDERGSDKIRLSRLIEIGIDRKLIDPDTDFVVVLSCRVPDEILPLGAKSPGNSSDSERSVGGGTKRSKQRARSKTCKRRRCNKYSCNKYSCNNK